MSRNPADILPFSDFQETRVRELTTNHFSIEKEKEVFLVFVFLNHYMSTLVCKSADTLEEEGCSGMSNSTGYQDLTKLK